MTEPREPGPEIVQWGTERSTGGGLPAWLAVGRWRWRDPRVAWVLAGLGGLALFGSLVDTWQVTRLPEDFTNGQLEEVTAEVPAVGAWGTGWLVGTIALATCLAVAVFGRPELRAAARSIGLALAGVQLAVLVAASLHLGRHSVLGSLFGLTPRGVELEPQLGRGVYAGFLGLALVGAALWWVRAGTDAGAPATAATAPAALAAPAEPVPVAPDGPPDLTVGPAEPFTHPGEDRTWR